MTEKNKVFKKKGLVSCEEPHSKTFQKIRKNVERGCLKRGSWLTENKLQIETSLLKREGQ